MGRVRVFLGMSLDGFIAGSDDELDWLLPGGEVEDTFTPFLSEVGVLLMGRRTFDAVCALDVPWPYGSTPVWVLTSRPLETEFESVRAVSGDVATVVAQARALAGERDVYVDGGVTVRAALDAGAVDEITLTVVPKVLGRGRPLFVGLAKARDLTLTDCRELGSGFVQLTYDVDSAD